jgi:hypothetical protein
MIGKIKLAIVAALVLGSASAAIARPNTLQIVPSYTIGCATGNTACNAPGP